MEPQAKLALEKIAGELENDQLAQAAVLLAEEHSAAAADILMALEEPLRTCWVGWRRKRPPKSWASCARRSGWRHCSFTPSRRSRL